MSKKINYVLFDGVYHQKLKPLTLTRPVADLRIGIFKIHEKWEHLLGEKVGIRTKDYLGKSYNSFNDNAGVGISGALIPNPELCDAINTLKEKTIMMNEGKVLAIKPLPLESSDVNNELEGYKIVQYTSEISMIEKPMDIFKLNGAQIEMDLKFYIKNKDLNTNPESGNLIIGDRVYIEHGAKVMGATLNSSDGPIYISKGAEVMEGSNLRGPLIIMENSVIKMGSKIYGSTTIGPFCKIGGELSNVVFQGYSNKAHDGFMGNSVIGYWCNFGADTNTSNLKNNYGIVKSWSYETASYESTETQYCGLIAGDHSKSSINTMFNTGSVLGAFVNVFDGGFPPKFIPSFSWGNKEKMKIYKFEKAMEVAENVMSRRGVALDEESIKIYKTISKQSSN
jgi:UDP-N-acetylglucosamine diphosphorylase/glucosamine-1-phosphate N-acetyltransferase